MSKRFLFYLFILTTINSGVYHINGQEDSLRLLYCREDLKITNLYPLTKRQYLVTDFGNIPGIAGREFRNVVLRYIGGSGFSEDSITFRSSIKDVIPISASKAIINTHDVSYEVQIENQRLQIVDSTTGLNSYQWLIADEDKEVVFPENRRSVVKGSNSNLKKLRGIEVLGAYNGYVVMQRRNEDRKINSARDLFVVNSVTNNVIQINESLRDVTKEWFKLDNSFAYWKRTIFFVDDQIYMSHPESGRCYIYNTITKKVSYFSFPEASRGVWFFTYDYVKNNSYLVHSLKSSFRIHRFESVEKPLIFLKKSEYFDNYIFADRIVIANLEKGQKGEMACFYYLPIYTEIVE